MYKTCKFAKFHFYFLSFPKNWFQNQESEVFLPIVKCAESVLLSDNTEIWNDEWTASDEFSKWKFWREKEREQKNSAPYEHLKKTVAVFSSKFRKDETKWKKRRSGEFAALERNKILLKSLKSILSLNWQQVRKKSSFYCPLKFLNAETKRKKKIFLKDPNKARETKELTRPERIEL